MSTDTETTTGPPPDGGGLEGYRARLDYWKEQGLPHREAVARARTSDPDEAASGGSDRAPRSGARRRRRGSGSAGGGPRPKASTAKQVREIVTTVGSLVELADDYSGAVLVENADRLGDAVGKAAAHDARIARAISGLATGGVYGGLVLAIAAILLPIAARYRLIPEPWASRIVMTHAPKRWAEANAEAVQQAAAAAMGAEPAPSPFAGASVGGA